MRFEKRNENTREAAGAENTYFESLHVKMR